MGKGKRGGEGNLTPFLVMEKVISDIGPWAGNESHKDRCMTVRFLVVEVVSTAFPFAVGVGSAFDDPYRSGSLIRSSF